MKKLNLALLFIHISGIASFHVSSTGDRFRVPITDDMESYNNVVNTFEKADVQWNNEFDGDLAMGCGSQSLFKVRSVHDNGREDRRWEWLCRDLTGGSDVAESYWTGYVNNFNEAIFNYCLPDYFMCGVHSYHDNGAEDRRWKFRCCRTNNYFTGHCGYTDNVNDLDGEMDFDVGHQKVLTGVFSTYDSGSKDRRWKFGYCELKYCQKS